MNTQSNHNDLPQKRQIEVFFPTNRYFTLVSESNTSEHWTKKRKRVTAQHKVVWYGLAEHKPPGSIELPCNVVLTRYGTKEYDDDNLVGSFKHIRDSVANFLKPGLAPGQADNDKRIKWTYLQVMIKDKSMHGVKIEIY